MTARKMVTTQRPNDCGVCAVANALGIWWPAAADLIWPEGWLHKRKFNTRRELLANAIDMPEGRFIRVRRGDDIPDGSIVKTIPSWAKWGWHAVVWKDGMIWDSIAPEPRRPLFAHWNHRLVSYIGVKP